MDCPHVAAARLLRAAPRRALPACTECSVHDQIWLCLHCGVLNCGRYVNGHAKAHAETTQHHLCMSCDTYSVYCYKCDEFPVNDNRENQIDSIRQILKSDNKAHGIEGQDISDIPENQCTSVSSSENPPSPLLCDETLLPRASSLEQLSPSKSSPRRRSQNDAPEDSVRNLRPRSRKRSHSEDSSSTENSSASSTSSNATSKKPNPHSPNGNGRIERQREKKVVGLKNLGNTCFMNAVLQSLSNIQEFSCYFNTLPSLEGKNNGRRVYHSRSYKEVQDVVMAEELRKVLINLNTGGCGSKGAISPEYLFLVIWKVVPRFRGYQQQDAHEFLRYMLDRLHSELLDLLPSQVNLKDGGYFSNFRGRNSIVTTVFGGTLQSEVRCLACGTESKKHDPFLDLSLDIPERLVSCNIGGVGTRKVNSNADDGISSPSSPMCSIGDCLTSFVEIEELADTELYLCGNCKSKQKSTKRFWIRRLPNVLCLHIKRFRWNNFFRTKIDTNISFPITELDMSQFVLSNLPETRRSSAANNLYDLAAVIVHHGSGAGSGHYTAFAINDGQWFHFNDSSVRPADVHTVATCKPYILFYIRREFSLPNDIGMNSQSSDIVSGESMDES